MWRFGRSLAPVERVHVLTAIEHECVSVIHYLQAKPVATNYLTGVAVHDYDPSIVYVTFSGYVAGQKVYKSCDGGNTWMNISGSLPNMPVDAIVHENKYNNPLYVGTDAGVYYVNDDLNDWIPYKTGLPNVIVDHLEIHYATKVIRAATYGRGAWQAPLK